MTITVVFKKDDVLGFSSFEDKVGAAYANRGVVAVIMKPTVETLRLTT